MQPPAVDSAVWRKCWNANSHTRDGAIGRETGVDAQWQQFRRPATE